MSAEPPLTPPVWQWVLVFDRDSHDFVMGVEIGRLWEMLKQPESFEQMIHVENVEMVVRMREAMERLGGV